MAHNLEWNPETLWEKFVILPDEAQKQVLDLLTKLATRHTFSPNPQSASKPPLSTEPFVGMWRDHDELADSTLWVRSHRRSEWERPNG
jgi:hypothetical protein